MSSDRFGQIRIKPEAENIPPKSRDKETTLPQMEKVPAETRKKRVPGLGHSGAGGRKWDFSLKPNRAMLWFAVPLFLVVLYGIGSYFLVPSLVKGPLTKNLSESLGRPVSVDRVVFSPFTLRLIMRSVSVGPVVGDPESKDLLACSAFRCRIDFPALFRRQVVCHEVKLDGVALNLVRMRLGSFTIADAANFFSLIKDKGSHILWPDWLDFDGVLLTDGRIVIDDSLARKQHQIEQIRFFLPSAQEAAADENTVPRLNAVINSSPVQIDGRRRINTQGEAETRFNLKFSEIVLGSYLEYVPAVQQNPFQLVEGQADVNVDLVIPELTDAEMPLTVQIDATIRSLRFTDKNEQTILKVPDARVTVQAVPSENKYILKKIDFSNPELSVLRKSQANAPGYGLKSDDLEQFVAGLELYPYAIHVDEFSVHDGEVHVFSPGEKTPRFIWEKTQLKLTGFLNKAARESVKDEQPARYQFSSRERSDTGGTELESEGMIQSASRIEGRFRAGDFDLKKYSAFLPAGISYGKGRADVKGRLVYALHTGSSQNSISPLYKILDGEISLRDFTFLRDKKTVLDGSQMTCQQMQADFSGKKLSCGNLTLAKNSIHADLVDLSELAGKKREQDQWEIRVMNLAVRNSRLQKQFANPFAGDRQVSVDLKNFSLSLGNITDADPGSNNLKASAAFAGGGTVLLSGKYAVATGEGDLLAKLSNVRLEVLKDFFTPWFVPEIKEGAVDAEGSFLLPEKVFTGSAGIRNLLAGREQEQTIEWKDAVAETLRLQTDPLVLQCDTVMVDSPVITFGISHAENPISLFFSPVSGSGTQKKQLAVQTVGFKNGSITLPEPVLLHGYQPKLSAVSGTLSSVGSGSMQFTVGGTMDDQAGFSVSGTTGLYTVDRYRLDVSNFSLAPFQSFFAENTGVEVVKAKGSWRQEMQRSETGYRTVSHIELHDVVPDPDSKFFKINALYIDEKNAIQLSGEEEYQAGEEQLFLFDHLNREIQQNAVRADLSEQLVLKKLLPDLDLVDGVQFVPGTATLVVTKKLADYEKLLARRPYLHLLLTGSYDPEQDRNKLRELLQEQEDKKRDEENRRRAAEMQRLEELEKKRREELKKDSRQVVEEKIDAVELSEKLLPLPYNEVQVPMDMLKELASKRTQALHNFFVNGLLILPEKIHATGETGQTGPEVQIRVLPRFKAVAGNKEVE